MDRRGFLTSCAAAAGGATLLGQATSAAAPSSDKPFANLPLKMSAPYGWFKGASTAERLDAVAAWGLPGTEWLGAKDDGSEFKTEAGKRGIQLSCVGGAGAISPGHMVQPSDHDKVVEQFKERIKVAQSYGCTTMIGLTGNERTDASYEDQMKYVVQCLERLAPIAEENNVTLVMEALNPLVDHKGFFLTRTDQTMEILKAINSPNVKMCFDIYHQQITEGNVIRNLSENIDRIGHFHVADNPGRKEPGTGELSYNNIFKAIHAAGYQGFVALECGHTKNLDATLNATRACFDWV